MGVPDYCQVLTDELDSALLSRFRVSRAMRHWIDPLLDARGVTEADLTAGIQMPVLRHLCSISHREILLARGEYNFGDVNNTAHLHNEPRGEKPTYDGHGRGYTAWANWEPEWREGYGQPPEIADGVTLIGQQGVVFAGSVQTARLKVRSKGVRFESLQFPHGLEVGHPYRLDVLASVTMVKCTSTGERILVPVGASLVMEDCRVFGSESVGVDVDGEVRATRCVVEENGAHGLFIYGTGGKGLAELVDCVIRKNGSNGLLAIASKVVLRGGTISGNMGHGVRASDGANVTVAPAEKDGLPQTVCKDNKNGNWTAIGEGLAQIVGSRRRTSPSDSGRRSSE